MIALSAPPQRIISLSPGATAMLFALFLPRGVWGTVEARWQVHVLPVGYVLREVVAHGDGPSPTGEA